VEVRASRASAVVVQRVPAASADWFMEWQRGVTGTAEAFAGYVGTDVYPPGDGLRDQWVVVIHFNDEQSLQGWLSSSVRAQWVEKLRAHVGDFDLKALPGGFSSWFTGLGPCIEAATPPSWKMALAVLFGLYPTVMVLTLFPGPYTQPLGLAFSMLIGNALSVSILQWLVMPVLNKLLGPWLKANSDRQRALSIGGLILIVVLLTGIAFLFRPITG
jgi:antibiotic biosynthesis monooxygenase (ABM) superfamily enzyme